MLAALVAMRGQGTEGGPAGSLLWTRGVANHLRLYAESGRKRKWFATSKRPPSAAADYAPRSASVGDIRAARPAG